MRNPSVPSSSFTPTFSSFVLGLQSLETHSRINFLLVLATKMFLKDGFIIFFILLPLQPFTNINQIIQDQIPPQAMTATLFLLIVVVFVTVAFIGGSYWKNKAARIGLMMGPWIDALAYPMIAILLAIVKQNSSVTLSVASMIISIWVSTL